MNKQATSRVAVAPEVQRAIRDFAFAANMKQGEAVGVLLSLYLKEGETPLEAGRRLAAEFAARDKPARA